MKSDDLLDPERKNGKIPALKNTGARFGAAGRGHATEMTLRVSSGSPAKRSILLRRHSKKSPPPIVPPPPLTGTQKESYHANWWAAGTRVVLWTWLLLKFFCAKYFDLLRHRGRIERNAERLRLMLQRMGPTAVKIGQQLSVRVDLLPAAYCDELEKLLDAAPPFPTAEAIAIIEKETERPLAAHFRTFNPVPIGSASLACVFKAELLNGQPVAIKVRRPDVAARLAADLKALTLLAALLGFLGRGEIRPIVAELVTMLVDELNFKLEAQHLLYFRKAIKNQKKVAVPKVYYHLCTCRLLVVEFVAGISMIEILRRAGSDDLAQLAQLEAEGCDRRKLARRLARFLYWELFDGVFFHADPHPGNLIVRPDSRISLIDFGSCGSLPRRLREALLDFNLAVSRRDLDEATRCLQTMHEPLPSLDYQAYVTEMRHMVQKTFLEVTNQKANWRERTVSVAFTESIAISRKYRIPMNINLLRYFRMVFLSDTILYRLYPQFNHQREVIAWYGERKELLNLAAIKRGELLQVDLAKLGETRTEIEQFAKRIKNRFEEIDTDFRATISKPSFAVKVLIGFIGQSVSLGVCFVLFRAVWVALHHQPLPYPSLMDHFRWLTSNPIYILIVLLMAARGLFKIYGRVREIDEDE